MKTIYSVSVIAAALLFFASCQKENLVSDNQQPVLRTITASFENAGTKTTLGEDDKPMWEIGDVIRLLDETVYEDKTLTAEMINDGSVTLTTTLDGETLYAVYPASATTMTSCSGSIDFTIPDLQDGTFASANICVAKGDSKDNLVFSNATSVLEFSQTASSTGVLRVAVTAANAIAGKCTATFGDDNKATISTSELAGKLIWTSAPTTAQDKYYVAIAPVVTGDVNFKYYTNLKEASENKTTKTLARNKIYGLTIPTDGYENSYVTIGGKKWAKTNLGATNPQDYGRYFQWGEIAGHECSGTTSGSTFKDSYSFNWASAPFNDGSSYDENYFTTNKGTWLNSDDVLKSDYDAAYQTWGSSWHIPTKEDFADLANKGVWYWTDDYNSTGVKGYIVYVAEDNSGDEGKANMKGTWKKWNGSSFSTTDASAATGSYDVTDSHMFFPAAGYGLATSLSNAGSRGYYWSSSLYSSPDSAYRLNFNSSSVAPQDDQYRYHGCSVRPVSD